MYDREALLAAVDLADLADDLLGAHVGPLRSPKWHCPNPLNTRRPDGPRRSASSTATRANSAGAATGAATAAAPSTSSWRAGEGTSATPSTTSPAESATTTAASTGRRRHVQR